MIDTKTAGFALLALLSFTALQCKTTPAERSSDSAASSTTPSAAASRTVISFPVPTGPRLAILAGQGVGAIRLGASVSTVERLMEVPCEEKTPTLCRYIGRAVEFELGEDGKVKKIRAHRRGRAAVGDKTYGVFNGAIPPDVAFGMLVRAVQEVLGPPDKVEDGNAGAAPEAVSQHRYKGMVLEYDRLANGNVVLGGVRIPD